ncbi:MAG: aromatic ring-hydroxylating dioxygenase subunit alpha [Pseudomonadales bacterium]|nr:aromatic ring-hydroxylating dioxygenase subunit alpha [Pseudomonadales bacterium]
MSGQDETLRHRVAGSGGFIRNLWYVAAWSHELADTPIGRVLLEEPVVFYRRADGAPVAMEDRCPHRFAPLSMGRVEGDDLRCMYHGLRFGCDGVCREMPAREPAPPVRVRIYPTVERWGWLWVWMGDPAQADPEKIPDAFGLQGAYDMRTDVMDIDACWELLNDNLCDLSHLDFSHATTLGASSAVRWSERKPHIEELPDGLRITRWFEDARMAPGHPLPVDTLSSYRYLLPGLFLMSMAWYPAGTAARCGYAEPVEPPLSSRADQQAVTPVTSRRSRYFFATGVARPQANQRLLDGIVAVVTAAFAEDKAILEAQQKIVDITPPERQRFATPHDAALLAFRRLVRARLAAEAETDAAR